MIERTIYQHWVRFTAETMIFGVFLLALLIGCYTVL